MAAKNNSSAAQEEKSPVERRFSVALNRASETKHNTIVLGGLDLIIPLERDLDKDPSTPDEIRLQSSGGWYESHVKSDDPEVKQDGDYPLNLFPFRDVPPGLYSIAVKVGNSWRNVLVGMRVTRDGVFYGTQSIEEDYDGSPLGTPIQEMEEIEHYFEEEKGCIC